MPCLPLRLVSRELGPFHIWDGADRRRQHLA
jgi:hypothetical protein